MILQDENSRTYFAFYFTTLKTLFLVNSKPVKITWILQNQNLKVAVSSKNMFCFQPKKLGQIYVDSRLNFSDMSQHVRLEGKHTVQRTHCAMHCGLVFSCPSHSSYWGINDEMVDLKF